MKAGDIVIGIEGNPYRHTGEGVLCVVCRMQGAAMSVYVYGDARKYRWDVSCRHFKVFRASIR